MAVDFKKRVAGKKTKLAGKTLESESVASESPVEESYQEGSLYKIPLDSIQPDPNQPRKYFDEIKMDELASSIAIKGVLQPIIIRKNDIEDIDSEFLVVAGERRYRASKQAGLEQIPALFTRGDPAEIALIENLQRDDLKPIEEAEAYATVMKSHNYNQKKLCEVVGKSKSTVSEILTLVSLPEEIKEECRTSNTPKNVLLEIAKRKDPKEMAFLFAKVKNESLTVAKIRQLTRSKPVRVVRDVDVRVLEKIKESSRLLHQLNKSELDDNTKEALRKEVQNFYDIASALISD